MRTLGVFALVAIILVSVLVWFTYGSNTVPLGVPSPTADEGARTKASSPLDAPVLVKETGPKPERVGAKSMGSQEVPTPPEQVTPEASSVPILPEDLSEENPYSDMTIAELRGEEAKLRAQVNELTEPIYEELLNAGRFEVVGTTEDYAGLSSKDNPGNKLLLSLRYELSTGQVRLIVIPEDEHPAPYVLWRRLLLVGQELRRKTDG